MKLFTYVIIVLMIMSVILTGVFVVSGEDNDNVIKGEHDGAKGQGKEQDRVSVSDSDEKGKKEAIVKLRGDKDSYFAAKERLQQANDNMKSGKINAFSKELFDARKEYLLETIDYAISNLEELKEKVDRSQREDADVVISEIDGYISELDAEKDKVEKATTTKELVRSARNIRDIWRDVVKDAYKTRTIFVDEKIGIYLNKSVSLSERLSKEIETLHQQGEDTVELEELLQEYINLIGQAKQNRERARETYQNGDNISREYWTAAAEELKDANSVLVRISQVLKTYRQGVVSLNGDSTLVARGNGTVVLSGDMVAEMTIDNAQLVIKDHAGDAKIKIIGNGSEIFLELDNAHAPEQKRALVYFDLTAKVNISGSRITVMVEGKELDLKVEGTGNAVLSGKGTYMAGTDEESKHWVSQFGSDFEENSALEE
ncbi:hypothetical protein [Methanomethylovorans sp.]|uniref:hypothetical protein n=1 Tax=Methanomethylovorans sp. TaxID=2758717 RepID=UPI00345EBEFE